MARKGLNKQPGYAPLGGRIRKIKKVAAFKTYEPVMRQRKSNKREFSFGLPSVSQIESQVRLIINGIIVDPMAIGVFIVALIFTISESAATSSDDLLSLLLKRMMDNEITKSFAVWLSANRPLFFAVLWFAVAALASSDKMRTMVMIMAFVLVFVFHQRSSWEFAAMSMTLYAFFKINIPEVRFFLVLVLAGIFWYFMVKNNDDQPTTPTPNHRSGRSVFHSMHHNSNAVTPDPSKTND